MISDLRGLDTFKSLLDKEEHFFAPSLCNLLCAIKNNKELWHATNEKALAEENENSAPLNAKEAKLLKALNNDHEKVEQYCNEHNILMPIGFMGSEGINEFRAYEQGKIVSSWHIIDSLIQAHINALNNLVNIDLEFVKQFAFTNEKGAITALKIYSLIDEWNVEKQALARKQTGQFWYAWKQLTEFHETYHDFEPLRVDVLKNGKLLEEWELCENLKRIKNLNNSKGDLYKKELRFYMQQIFYRLPQILQKLPTQQSEPQLAEKVIERAKEEVVITILEKQINISFSNNQAICFDQYEIQDQQEGEILRFKLLKILVNEYPKALSRQELRDSLNASDKEINRARRGIKDRLPKKYEEFITRSRQGKMAFNDRYYIVLKNELATR